MPISREELRYLPQDLQDAILARAQREEVREEAEQENFVENGPRRICEVCGESYNLVSQLMCNCSVPVIEDYDYSRIQQITFEDANKLVACTLFNLPTITCNTCGTQYKTHCACSLDEVPNGTVIQEMHGIVIPDDVELTVVDRYYCINGEPLYRISCPPSLSDRECLCLPCIIANIVGRTSQWRPIRRTNEQVELDDQIRYAEAQNFSIVVEVITAMPGVEIPEHMEISLAKGIYYINGIEINKINCPPRKFGEQCQCLCCQISKSINRPRHPMRLYNPAKPHKAVNPQSKVIIGEMKTATRQVEQVDKLAQKFKEVKKLQRAKNMLVEHGVEVSDIPFPDYFANIEQEAMQQPIVLAKHLQRIRDLHPDSNIQWDNCRNVFRFYSRTYSNRRMNKDTIYKLLNRYLSHLQDRDKFLEYELVDIGNSYNGLYRLKLTTVATNLAPDRDGHFVNECMYPWLAEIIDNQGLLPFVTATFYVKDNRHIEPRRSRERHLSESTDAVIVNRHMSRHGCFGTAREATENNSKRLHRNLAQAYTASISMNLHESESYPFFNERYYKFYDPEADKIVMVDTAKSKCNYCDSQEACESGQEKERFQRCETYQLIERTEAESTGNTGAESASF